MSPDEVLSGIPPGLRVPLLDAFNSILKNYRERRWEPAELNGGKLSEVAYSVLRGYVDGEFPSRPSKPRNFADACRQLESADASRVPRAVRVQIPRVLVALYEVRNNRGVGHVGGDVDPCEMDAAFVVSSSQWLIAELIRVFHGVSTDVAARAVHVVVERTLPIVWDVNGVRRVLSPAMSMRDKALLLLYSASQPVQEYELVRWVEHSNATVFRKSVLVPAHRERLIEYDRAQRTVQLSPAGVRYVEERVPLQV